MEMIHDGYRGLSVMVNLNWDRLVYLATIFAALMAGGYLGSLL